VYNSRREGSAMDVSNRDGCIDFGNIKLEYEPTVSHSLNPIGHDPSCTTLDTVSECDHSRELTFVSNSAEHMTH
jgi:hypothetical protein